MPLVRVNNFAMSLDGFVAGPDQSQDNPLGRGGEQLHEWFVVTHNFRRMHGMDEGSLGIDNDFAAGGIDNVGAHIIGRNMFGPVRGAWPDESWRGWWGEEPPYHHPVFVLTHYPREPLEMDGGTTFHFVSDGIEAALSRAREAAGDHDVVIGGGATTVREYLDADLIDQMHLAVAPLLLGSGERLFEGIELTDRFDFEPVQSSSGAAHFVLRRRA